MNNYQKLRKLYNDTFYPDGVPFEFGCEYRDTVGQKCVFLDINNSKVFIPNLGIATDFEGYTDTHPVILGKPLTLQDVLRLLDIFVGGQEVLARTFMGDFNWGYMSGFNSTGDEDFIDIDLSIPFHEQPEEVFEKIYQLVK